MLAGDLLTSSDPEQNQPQAAYVAPAQPAAQVGSTTSSTAETSSSDQNAAQRPPLPGEFSIPPSAPDSWGQDFLVRRDPETGRLIFVPSATIPAPQQAKESAVSQAVPEQERFPVLLNLSPLFPDEVKFAAILPPPPNSQQPPRLVLFPRPKLPDSETKPTEEQEQWFQRLSDLQTGGNIRLTLQQIEQLDQAGLVVPPYPHQPEDFVVVRYRDSHFAYYDLIFRRTDSGDYELANSLFVGGSFFQLAEHAASKPVDPLQLPGINGAKIEATFAEQYAHIPDALRLLEILKQAGYQVQVSASLTSDDWWPDHQNKIIYINSHTWMIFEQTPENAAHQLYEALAVEFYGVGGIVLPETFDAMVTRVGTGALKVMGGGITIKAGAGLSATGKGAVVGVPMIVVGGSMVTEGFTQIFSRERPFNPALEGMVLLGEQLAGAEGGRIAGTGYRALEFGTVLVAPATISRLGRTGVLPPERPPLLGVFCRPRPVVPGASGPLGPFAAASEEPFWLFTHVRPVGREQLLLPFSEVADDLGRIGANAPESVLVLTPQSPVTGSQWYMYFISRYGPDSVEWVSAVPRYDGTKTMGVLATAVGDIRLVSGKQGPSALFPPRTIPGRHGTIMWHVESHAIASMWALNQQRGILFINRVPCGLDPPWTRGCYYMIPHMLPQGAKIRIIGPNGFDEVFSSLPK